MIDPERFLAPPGWAVHHLAETGSTNDLAKEAGRAGDPERSVFVTDHQTRGRGRMDRSWLEEPGSSLLFSILFRRHVSQSFLLTMITSVAAAGAVERLAGVPVQIKWPNDLMAGGRKLAGVLTETSWAGAEGFAVVGMGINVNFDPPALHGIPDTATSLLRETGRSYSRAALLYEILDRLDGYLTAPTQEAEPRVRSEWAARLWRQRQQVTIAEGGETLQGTFEGVGDDGSLLLRLDDGALRSILAGDLLI